MTWRAMKHRRGSFPQGLSSGDPTPWHAHEGNERKGSEEGQALGRVGGSSLTDCCFSSESSVREKCPDRFIAVLSRPAFAPFI